MKNKIDLLNKIFDYGAFWKSSKSSFSSLRDALRAALRLFAAVVFFPALAALLLFENRFIARVMKQMMIFLYCIFLLIFIYSACSYSSYLRSYRVVSVELPFGDRLKDMK
ncbi:MAG: hypothetical protein LBB09_01810 [Rickettsiales bacterium]|jgi:hypothetical protein|nr:hypothetical protein [Rickettsiales bacterium]